MNRYARLLAALLVLPLAAASAAPVAVQASALPSSAQRAVADAHVQAFVKTCLQAREQEAIYAAAIALGGKHTRRYDSTGAGPVALRIAGRMARLEGPYSLCLLEFEKVDVTAAAMAFDAMAATLAGARPDAVDPSLDGIHRNLQWQPADSTVPMRVMLVDLGNGTLRLHRDLPEPAPLTPEEIQKVDHSDLPPGEDQEGRRLHLPRFPAEAIRECAFGKVRLRVTVDATGKVIRVGIDLSSGHESLDLSAAEAARNWRFYPGRLNGQPVGGDVIVPVAFQNPC